MTRTTVDLDPTVLRQLKERGRREGKSLGTVASELLASALGSEPTGDPKPLTWRSQSMGALIDIDDKEAVWRILDGR
jgi:hypothetical protein